MTEIEVNLKELRETLDRVVPFASDDSTMPMLNAVRWQVDGQRLILTATDRYALARAVVPTVNDASAQQVPPFSVSVADVHRIVATFKATNRRQTVTLDADMLSISDGSATLRLERNDWEFPDLTPLWQEAIAVARGVAPVAAPTILNVKYTARFVGTDPPQPAVLWPTKPGKPQLVTVGDSFQGLIMQVRMEDADGQLNSLESDFAVRGDTGIQKVPS